MRVAIYKTENGRIARVIDCPETMVAMQVQAGEAWIELVSGDDSTHYVDGGAARDIPARPSEHHVFDFALKSWVDPRTLQDRRDAQWVVIKAARAAAEFGGFAWDGSTFDSDAISQSRIQGAVQLAALAGEAFSIDWTLADNSARTLSGADMEAVGVALGQHVAEQHGKARILRAAIDAATTEAAISSITW